MLPLPPVAKYRSAACRRRGEQASGSPASARPFDQGASTVSGLIKRGDLWHLRFRVPRRYAAIETRAELHRSLKTGDKDEAEARKSVVKAEILAELDARLAGQDAPGAQQHYDAIARLAAGRGYRYKTASELAGGDLGALLTRITDLQSRGDAPGSEAATALVGGVERPRVTLRTVAEQMPDTYQEEVHTKNKGQKRRWAYRWLRPAKKFEKHVGMDPVLDEISREQALSFRDSLKKEVLDGRLAGSSAARDIVNLDLLWRKYHLSLGMDPETTPNSPFRGLGQGLAKIGEETRKKEVPIENLQKLVQPGALRFANNELRDIILVLIETGARQSEITDIAPCHIQLDAPIPHLQILYQTGDLAREVKNRSSRRNIPLVGVALDAMKRNPQGFPRYRNAGTFSAAANKSLRAKGLLPEGVTIGGLRHSFESRLRKALVPSDERGELMGHSVKRLRGRERYGDEMTLEEKRAIHERIALRPEASQM